MNADSDQFGRRQGMETNIWGLPNVITYLRMALIPVVMLLAQYPSVSMGRWAALVFALASATDALDGYLARKWGQISWIGELLDPLADKLLVVGTLLVLIPHERISAWLVFVLLAREMLITGLRSIAAGAGLIIAAGRLGKQKTILQMLGIVCLLIQDPPFVSLVGLGLVGLSLVLSYASAYQYLVNFVQAMQKR